MYDAFFENVRVLIVVTILVDECRHAAVCKASDRVTVSYGEVAYDVQVLERRCAAAEPTVVRDVYHQAGTGLDCFSDEISENGVIADVGSPVVRAVNRSFLSGNEVAFAKIDIV